MHGGFPARLQAGEITLDADRLTSLLYQGSAPDSAEQVRAAGFNTLVLAAREVQPPEHAVGSLTVLRCPLVDDPTRAVTPPEWKQILGCAKRVHHYLSAGQPVLVTCVQGWNRSGIISAATLVIHHGWTPAKAIQHVQAHRRHALSNPRFVEALLRW